MLESVSISPKGPGKAPLKPLLPGLLAECLTVTLDAVKTLTTREFFHAPGLIKALRPGQTVVVTDNGKPAVTVTKAGQRPRRSREELERENREICPAATPKVNFTTAIRDLKLR